MDKALKEFLQLIPADHVAVFDIPGAYELQLMMKELMECSEYDVIAYAAFVVDGVICHNEFDIQSIF